MSIFKDISDAFRTVKAFRAFSTGDYASAIPLLEKQLAEDSISNKQDCYYLLGFSYFKTGNTEMAVQSLATAFSMYSEMFAANPNVDIKDGLVLTGIAYGRALEKAEQRDLAINVLKFVKKAQANHTIKADEK